MAARNDRILLKNGSLLSLGNFHVGEPDIYSFAMAKSTQVPSVLSFSGDVVAAGKPVVDDSVVTYLSTPKDATTVNSQAYKNKENEFDDGVRWIWGSLSRGGAYIRKTAANNYKIGGVTGFFRVGSDNYEYVINEQSVNRSLSDFSDVCFMYDDQSLTWDLPYIYVFTNGGMGIIPGAPEGSLDHYWNYRVYNSLISSYGDWQPLNDMDDVVHYITWEGITGNKPSCYWESQSTPPKDLDHIILGGQFSGMTRIKGDIWGGQKADDEDDPNRDAGSSEEQGGNGDYPEETSHVDTPDSSSMTTSIVNSGFITLYNPTLANVKSFSDFLFTDIDEVTSIQLKRLIADPIDFTLFLAMCHFTPPSTITDNIMYAGIDTGVSAKKINNQFKVIDCGTVHISGDTKTFLDYNNTTKISIYLPYAGIKELNADDVVGSDVNCTYNIDMLTGDCLITIKCVRNIRKQMGDAELDDVLYTFTGNCYETVPLTATDWRNVFTSSISLVSGGIALAGGNVAGIGAIANAIMTEKVSVEKSGNVSSNFGYMGVQYPYIILERPVTANPYNYRAFKGYVLNMHYNLGDLSGYTEIEGETLWIDGFDGITESEAEMLKQITSSGFYL